MLGTRCLPALWFLLDHLNLRQTSAHALPLLRVATHPIAALLIALHPAASVGFNLPLIAARLLSQRPPHEMVLLLRRLASGTLLAFDSPLTSGCLGLLPATVRLSAGSAINLRGLGGIHASVPAAPHPVALITSALQEPLFAQPWLMFAFLVGLVMGSFGNACIFRWPREESVRFGRSRCPHCDQVIRWFDNIPLLSWATLRGRCRRCRGPISARYPATELLCGVAFAASFAGFPGSRVVAAALLLWALIVVFWVDIDHRIIPNEITIPLTLAGIMLSPWFLMQPEDNLFDAIASLMGVNLLIVHPTLLSIAGAAIGGGIVLLIRWLGQLIYRQEAMGLGDVKLLMFVGSWLGPAGALKTLFLGAIIGGVVSILLLVIRRVGRRSYIPFGPFLAVGAVLALFRLP